MNIRVPQPTCPRCSGEPTRSITRFGIRHDCCNLWSWDGAPLVDRETHDARTEAHKHFDAYWQSKGISRRDAYRKLASAMGMSLKDCHIKLMDATTAQRVVRIVGDWV